MKNFLLFSFFVLSGFAVLPPLAQNVREMKMLLEHPILYERLGSHEMIEQIQRTERGYVVIGKNSVVYVDIEYFPNANRIGPPHLEFHFNEAQGRGL